MNIFLTVLRIILYPIYRILFWYTIEGKENLPKDRSVVFCSNHISLLDPVFWLITIRRPRIHFMAKEELFKIPIFKNLITWADAFPVRRGKGDTSAISESRDVIKKGDVLGIFPEGTRSKDGRPARAKSGAAYIANESHCDIVPAAVVCKGKVRPFKRVRLIVGKPIPYDKIAFTKEDRRNGLRNASNVIMGSITELWEAGQQKCAK